MTERREERIERWDKQFARLTVARELDKSGRIEEVVCIYEELVGEGLEHAHIYRRLAVIYRQAKRYDDEIRVMEKGFEVWRDFETTYGTLGRGFAECHHKLSLSETGPTRTRLRDLAIICPNCHRMLHRARPWKIVEELSRIIRVPV
jgi:hypothetical protein